MATTPRRRRRRTTLAEKIASGTYRPDRHAHLFVGATKPTGLPDEEWNALAREALDYLRRPGPIDRSEPVLDDLAERHADLMKAHGHRELWPVSGPCEMEMELKLGPNPLRFPPPD
jgi:hypothetical protein